MNTATALDLLEVETGEQETDYNVWLRAKLTASLADPRPRIPHAQVMAEMDALIDRIEAETAA